MPREDNHQFTGINAAHESTTVHADNLTTNAVICGTISVENLPTSSYGLGSGNLWNNNGVISIIPFVLGNEVPNLL